MTGINNWEYASWVITIGRSLRLNPAVAGSDELTMVTQFVNAEINVRTWLKDDFYKLSAQRQGLVTADNPQVLGKMVELIGRDLMKIQVLNFLEKLVIDLVVASTYSRCFGEHGARISSDVTVPA